MDIFGEAFVETGSLLEDCLLVECEVAVLGDEGGDAGQMGSFGGGFKDLNFAPKTRTNTLVSSHCKTPLDPCSQIRVTCK